MALLTIEIPENLLSKLKQTGRSAQEVIVEALAETLHAEALEEDITSLSSVSQALEPSEKELLSMPFRRERKSKDEDLPRDEVVRRLLDAGFIRQPEEYDSLVTQEWLALSEEQRQQRINEIDALYFPDSPASRAVIRNRKRLETDVPRQEVIRRLVATGLIRSPGSWDMEAAHQWRQLAAEEQHKLIDEVTALYFPDSPASKFLIEEMET